MSAGKLSRPAREPPSQLLVVDDHPAVRAGLIALLETESALSLLPAAAGFQDALLLARERIPDIALLDISLEDGDGLRLCLELKQLPAPPAVLLYTASADPLLALKARLVGADGLTGKHARGGELRAAIQTVLRGEARLPAFDRELFEAKSTQLSPEDLALIGLRLSCTPIEGIAAVLGVDEDTVLARISQLLGVLHEDEPL